MEFHIRTVFFLGILTGIFLLLGGLLGGTEGVIIAFVFAAVLNLGSYYFSDKIALAMYKAQPAEVKTVDGRRMQDIASRIAQRMELPMPRLFIVNESSPNAFATGRGPNHSAIVFTTGILSLLNDSELEGVMAHELAHVKNRDVLIASMAATIAGAIGMIAHSMMWFGVGGREENQNPIGLLILAISIPIIATLVQLAVSRSREFLADETAAKTLNSGTGLSSALRKLETGIHRNPMENANEGTAHLFISNPFAGEGLMGVFMTHPPLAERVKRLDSGVWR
ncbi:MAG: M48 family metalloprotease [archaeon]